MGGGLPRSWERLKSRIRRTCGPGSLTPWKSFLPCRRDGIGHADSSAFRASTCDASVRSTSWSGRPRSSARSSPSSTAGTPHVSGDAGARLSLRACPEDVGVRGGARGVPREERVAAARSEFRGAASGRRPVRPQRAPDPDEIDYILEHCGASVIVYDAEFEPLLPASSANPTRPRRRALEPGDSRVRNAPAAASSVPVENPVTDEDETISINYTSGTTGHPKGVMYTYRGAYLNALAEVFQPGCARRSRLPLDAADVPLQRLVFSVGRHGRGRDARLPARRSNRPTITELIDERRRHAPVRRADRARSRIANASGRAAFQAAAARSRPPARRRRPTTIAQIEEARRDDRASLRPDRNLRSDHGLRGSSPQWDGSRTSRTRAAQGAAGRRDDHRRRERRARRRRRRLNDVPPTARRTAKWSCAATT